MGGNIETSTTEGALRQKFILKMLLSFDLRYFVGILQVSVSL